MLLVSMMTFRDEFCCCFNDYLQRFAGVRCLSSGEVPENWVSGRCFSEVGHIQNLLHPAGIGLRSCFSTVQIFSSSLHFDVRVVASSSTVTFIIPIEYLLAFVLDIIYVYSHKHNQSRFPRRRFRTLLFFSVFFSNPNLSFPRAAIHPAGFFFVSSPSIAVRYCSLASET